MHCQYHMTQILVSNLTSSGPYNKLTSYSTAAQPLLHVLNHLRHFPPSNPSLPPPRHLPPQSHPPPRRLLRPRLRDSTDALLPLRRCYCLGSVFPFSPLRAERLLIDSLTNQAHTLSHPTDANSSSHASAELQAALFALRQVEPTWEGARCASTLLGDFLKRVRLVQEVSVDGDEIEEEEEDEGAGAGAEGGGELSISPRMNEFWLA
jgi:hypothetical protein